MTSKKNEDVIGKVGLRSAYQFKKFVIAVSQSGGVIKVIYPSMSW